MNSLVHYSYELRDLCGVSRMQKQSALYCK